VTVQRVDKDPDAKTMTVTAEFDAPVERVWQLWADPRLLERWWGPPTYPATVVEHELVTGGKVTYSMTGPEGDQSHGWWRVVAVEPPHRLEFEDGFADSSGEPAAGMPVMIMRVELADLGEGSTRMTVETAFASLEDMERVIGMGMEEGIKQAMGQIDALLAAPADR